MTTSASTFWNRAAYALVVFVSYAGCSAKHDAPAGDTNGASPAPQALTCDVGEEIPLLVSAEDGELLRLHVPVQRASGDTAVLGIDTGSPITLTYQDVGRQTVSYGCTTQTIAPFHIPSFGETVDGTPKLGLLGADAVLVRPTLIDPVGSRLVRYTSRQGLPDTTSWSRTTFEVSHEQILVRAIVDGTEVKLLLDTGAPRIMLLGQAGRPGDTAVTGRDANGQPIDIEAGPSVVAFAGEADKILTVERTLKWDYLESKLAYLGEDINGLFGLGALGMRRFLIDVETHEIRLEPQR